MQDPKDAGLNTPSEQEEILHKEVNPTGEGEHPAIKAVVSDEFATMSDEDAFDVAKALRDLIRGQAALLKNQQAQDEEVRKIQQRFAEIEDANKRWQEDPAKFAAEASVKADKVRLTGAEKERAIAEGVRIQREAIEVANAEAMDELLRFRQKCANAPKTIIASGGKHWRTKAGDGYKDVVEAEVIRVSVGKKIFQWKLMPDEPTEVPDFIAQEYWARKRNLKEQNKIKEALSPDINGQFRNYDDLQREFPDLNPSAQMSGDVVNMN